MGSVDSQDIILGIFYVTGAVALLIAAYLAYIRKFKRAKLEAISMTELVTSRENIFSAKTQFLLILPQQKQVKLSLLNEQEEVVKVLLEKTYAAGEHPFDFDPTGEKAGKYYLYLEAEDTNIMRRIFIRPLN